MSPEEAKRVQLLASVVGLSAFTSRKPELAGLASFLAPLAESARRAMESADPAQGMVELDMACGLVRLLLRSGLSAERCAQLDANTSGALVAIAAAAAPKRAPRGTLEA